MDFSELVAAIENADRTAALCRQADAVRRDALGDDVHLRAIVEFSNHCRNRCLYCGINRGNRSLPRYRLSWPETITAVEAAAGRGLRTIVLQSGEDPSIDLDGFAPAIAEIKRRWGIAVTLACGEWPRDVYARWRDAGADRYLLKLETTDERLYDAVHPGMSLANRRRCLDDLFALGYQVGTGNLVGLPGQTAAHLAHDLLEFAEQPYDMIAIGPLIPANGTALAHLPKPPADLVLRVVALARLLAPEAHIPSTSALCALDPATRRQALEAGANVVMINFTPHEVAGQYRIYPRAACGSTQNCLNCLQETIAALGRRVALDAGAGRRSRKDADHAP
jgi:biotin synthase